ncbi:MAG: aldo/keto reductase [Bryobacter sp.]|jgi:predicted aldo/keto reductase-like oxidoreductase|nr:aldo/keto reductase [Bryobacter sp. CoA8 C33]
MDNTRRDFIAGAAALPLAGSLAAQNTPAGIPTRPLGKTGVQVSILGLGGHHQARPKDEKDSFHLVHAAIDNGITFMDNAWDYHDGRAEEVMGKALAMDGYRKKAFLMTKVCDRDYAGAMKHLEDSLRRLRTDVIDLWQFHECNYYNDPEYIVEKGGLKAAIEAKKQGKVRFIGFTGHKHPRIHRKMLALNFPWDSCQMPNNPMDYRFESFRHEVMPECARKGVGVIGMKGCGGDGRMLRDGVVTVEECYNYFLSQPVSTQVVGLANMDDLNRALKIAREFKPMTPAALQTLSTRLKDVAGDGRYEHFKTTQRYDAGYHRKQHGFAE